MRTLRSRCRSPLSPLALVVLAGLLPGGAGAQEAARPLPFSDDMLPPPPLPAPLDRHFRGELLEFDGERVRLQWDWSDAAQLEDFEAFVPVRHGLRGGFALGEGEAAGALLAQGTGGLRLRMGMLDDLFDWQLVARKWPDVPTRAKVCRVVSEQLSGDRQIPAEALQHVLPRP